MGRPRKVKAEDAATLDRAEEYVQQAIADAPNGIHILSKGDDGQEPVPSVSGGMTREEREAKLFGPLWWVKVVELDLPYSKDVIPVSLACRGGTYHKEFRCNVEVALPENAIRVLEDACVINERAINIGPQGIRSVRDAEALNPGMTIVQRGIQYLAVEKRPRFHVQRIRPYQESYVLAAT